jgi:hypothetical protein
LTWAKLDLSFVAEKKLDLGFSTLKKGRYRGGVSDTVNLKSTERKSRNNPCKAPHKA